MYLNLDKDSYFRDGRRLIDYILVLNQDIIKKPDDMHPVADFMSFLEENGLEFEMEKAKQDNGVLYVKVHCPKKPLKQLATLYGVDIFNKGHSYYLFAEKEQEKKNKFMKLFDNELADKDRFVRANPGEATRAERIMIVGKLMTTSSSQVQGYNLTQLLQKGLVKDAFPLHDGNCLWVENPAEMNERQLLTKFWANKRFYQKQPLNMIEKYFGPEVAYYYAWLGFYNKMLIPAAIVSVICFFNAVFFDVFSLNEHTLPEFAEKTKYRRLSPITGEIEPYVPIPIKVLRVSASLCVMLLLIILLFVLSMLLILMKLQLRKLFREMDSTRPWAPIIATNIGAFVGMVIIEIITKLLVLCIIWTLYYISNQVTAPLTYLLTGIENPRTQKAYNSRVIYKSFVLAFFNNYLMLLYHTFIQGRLYNPKNTGVITYFDYDVCAVNGCMMFLGVHILYILASKIPVFHSIRFFYKMRKIDSAAAKKNNDWPLWERNHVFLRPIAENMFPCLYRLQMVRFGLVSFFAGPLTIGPLIALIINHVDFRLSSNKLIQLHRRPLPKQVSGLGEWNNILKAISLCCVVTNAVIVCSVSDLIPKIAFKYTTSDNSLKGFLNWFLSEVDRRDIGDMNNQKLTDNITTCWYLGMFRPPESPLQYEANNESWVVEKLRLIFLISIEHVIFIVTVIVGYMIPVLPHSVKQQLSDEKKRDQALRVRKIIEGKKKKNLEAKRAKEQQRNEESS